jgi:hypothetical protein
MAIQRRLTADTQIISRKDPALACAGEKAVEYMRTLDIDKLGDRTEWALAPSVFTVKPLMPEYEHYAYDMSGPDCWRVFQAHVRDCTELPFKLQFVEGKLSQDHRADFPPEIVLDVATCIIQLANKNDSTFFGLQVDCMDSLREAARAMATQAAQAVASMAAANVKKPSTEPSKSTGDTPQNSESK